VCVSNFYRPVAVPSFSLFLPAREIDFLVATLYRAESWIREASVPISDPDAVCRRWKTRARVLKTHANVCLCVSRGFRDLSGSLGGRLGILVIDGTAASLAGTDDTRGETRTELYSSVMPARPNQAESGRIDAELCRRLIPPNRDSACRAFLPITRADHRALVDPPVTSVTGLPRIRVIGVIDVIDEGTRPTISPSIGESAVHRYDASTVKRT